MLGNVKQYSRIYLAYGYTDLRFGIDGLARVVQDHFSLDPFQKGCLFLFCGRQTASKDFCGKATASRLFIKDWKRGVFSGQERRQKPVRSHRNSSHG